MDYIIMENGEKILLETQQKVTIQRTVDIYKQYRKELGLTQSELGKRAGISQPNITRFESGNYNPSLEFLVKIAGAMGKKVIVTLEDYSGASSNARRYFEDRRTVFCPAAKVVLSNQTGREPGSGNQLSG